MTLIFAIIITSNYTTGFKPQNKAELQTAVDACIDGMDWLVERQTPSWIYCLYDGETSFYTISSVEDFLAKRLRRQKRKTAISVAKRKRAVDEIRHHIYIKGSRAQEFVNDFLAELIRDAREED